MKGEIAEFLIDEYITQALKEDVCQGLDVTSVAMVPESTSGTLSMVAREEGILAGIQLARRSFEISDSSLQVSVLCQDGEKIMPGQAILEVSGPARAILLAERTALNFTTHLSGVSSLTARYVEELNGLETDIVCTRKTIPGLRMLQKYAVRMGGGKNHRFSLGDGVLVKDNHIAIAGSLEKALKMIRRNAGHMVKIEVEVDTLEQLERALEYDIDAVLLDNMAPQTLKKAVHIIDGRVISEASGGVTLETVREIGLSGVDIISVGALTHSSKAIDIGLDIALEA
jgi:nicotinate-nucleotide pyrophosphorylase (carboxylating)